MTLVSQFSDVHIPDTLSLPHFVLSRAAQYGDNVALIDFYSRRQITYQQLPKLCESLAASLQQRGLTHGDVVAIYAPNCPDFAVVLHGVALAGATLSPINPIYTVKELKHQLHDSNAKFIFTIPELVGNVHATKHPFVEVFTFRETEGATPYDVLLRPEVDFQPVLIRPKEDVVVLPYSSGTTSLPKGVRLSHYNVVANICQQNHPELLKYGPGDVMLGLLPFFHIYGMTVVLNAALYNGVQIVTLPRFEPEPFLQTLERHKVTVLPVAPPVILFLAKHPIVAKYNLSHLRDVVSGAAPLGQELAEACVKRLKVALRQGYGMTEMSPVSHSMSPWATNPKYSSVGRLLPNMQMRIVDVETGKPVPMGSRGEFLLRGPNIMLGYHNNPAATADTLDNEGFLHTGDVGYMDTDGDFFIVDRCKELIKVKGFQVAPAELEDLLLSHPAVEDCAVIGIPQDEDEAPKAYVVLKAQYKPSEALKEQIISFAAQDSAAYKRIREVEFIGQIPKSPAGKILRRELRSMNAGPHSKL
eukprot:GGOE01033725.1.p1 GENE.GGOE01033725.1~~GGOE01033725.1.p1  ORF type:complete len:529 (+),score=196.85 GGOE01033725.1:38-1624(+)